MCMSDGAICLSLFRPFFFVSDLLIDDVADILVILFLVLEALILATEGVAREYGKH